MIPLELKTFIIMTIIIIIIMIMIIIIHSGYFYSASSSPLLLRGTRDYTIVGVNTPMRYRQLHVKDLPKVPTWRLKWDSNLPASECNVLNLPLSHHPH